MSENINNLLNRASEAIDNAAWTPPQLRTSSPIGTPRRTASMGGDLTETEDTDGHGDDVATLNQMLYLSILNDELNDQGASRNGGDRAVHNYVSSSIDNDELPRGRHPPTVSTASNTSTDAVHLRFGSPTRINVQQPSIPNPCPSVDPKTKQRCNLMYLRQQYDGALNAHAKIIQESKGFMTFEEALNWAKCKAGGFVVKGGNRLTKFLETENKDHGSIAVQCGIFRPNHFTYLDEIKAYWDTVGTNNGVLPVWQFVKETQAAKTRANTSTPAMTTGTSADSGRTTR